MGVPKVRVRVESLACCTARSCLATPDDGCVEFPAINIVYGIGFACSALLLAWRGKEPPPAAKIERVRYSCEDTIPMLIATFLNRPFRSVLAVEAAKAAGQDIPYIILPYLTAWLLGEKCLPSTKVFQYIVLCNLGMGLLSVPLWSCFVSRTSKHAGTLAYNLLLGVVKLCYSDPSERPGNHQDPIFHDAWEARCWEHVLTLWALAWRSRPPPHDWCLCRPCLRTE